MASIYDFLQPGAREQAGYAGLMQLASGLVQGGAPSLQPGGAMRGLGLGLGGFNQGYQGSINSAVQQGMLGSQLADAQRKREQEEAMRQAQARLTARLTGPGGSMARNPQMASAGPNMSPGAPPVDMAALLRDPNAFADVVASGGGDPLKAMALMQKDDDPKKRYMEVNGQLVDLKGQGGPRPVSGIQQKAPEGYRYTQDGSLELIPGYAKGKGEITSLTEPLVPVLNPTDGTVTYKRRGQAEGQAAPDQATIVMGPDGKPIFMRGGSQAMQGMMSGLGQNAQNKVQEQLIDMTAQTAQVNRIASQFRPEYQQIGTRAGLSWATIRDKAGMNLNGSERQQVADFAKYRAEAGQYFADRLRAMSGAAVTEQEMKRQEAYLPTPGTGIFDGDSPTEFQAKTKRMQEFMQQATARLHYVSKKGMSIKDVPLEDMPKIIRSRGNELAAEYAKRNLEGDDLKAAVRRQLAGEFGLVSD